MRRAVNSPYRITLKFGATSSPYSKSNPHNGTDYVSDDEKVLATHDGTITYLGDTKGKSGFMIALDDRKDRVTFSHLRAGSFRVKQGQKVKAGTWLADMGASGLATGVHVHVNMNSGKDDIEKHIKEQDVKTTKSTAIWLVRTLTHEHNPPKKIWQNWVGLDDEALRKRLANVYASAWFKKQTAAIKGSETGKVEAIWTKVKSAFGK